VVVLITTPVKHAKKEPVAGSLSELLLVGVLVLPLLDRDVGSEDGESEHNSVSKLSQLLLGLVSELDINVSVVVFSDVELHYSSY
jgi:hypothetical protein